MKLDGAREAWKAAKKALREKREPSQAPDVAAAAPAAGETFGAVLDDWLAIDQAKELIMGPAEMPLTRPSAANERMTNSLRAAITNRAADRARPPCITTACRPSRSARMPPRGSERLDSQRTKLMVDLAAARLHLRSVSIAVPKPKTVRSAALYSDQMQPAATMARRPDCGTGCARWQRWRSIKKYHQQQSKRDEA